MKSVKLLIYAVLTFSLFVGCSAIDKNGGDHTFEGVSFIAEFEYYPEGTRNIKTLFENNTEIPLTVFTSGYGLKEFNTEHNDWMYINIREGLNIAFNSTSRLHLPIGGSVSYYFPLEIFYESIAEGNYMALIALDVPRTDGKHSNGGADFFIVSAEFAVTSDVSLLE